MINKEILVSSFVFILLISNTLIICNQNTILPSSFQLDDYVISLSSNDYSIWTWSDLEIITSDSEVSFQPDIKLDSLGNIHVVWISGITIGVQYKIWNKTTEMWSSPLTLSIGSGYWRESPKIAVDFSNNIHVSWVDQYNYLDSGFDIDVVYTCWNSTLNSWTAIDVVSDASSLDSMSPSVKTDSKGNVHFVWTEEDGINDDIFYKNWDVTTESWSSAILISTEGNGMSQSPSITCDSKDNIHISWMDAYDYLGSGNDYDIFYKYWDANSESWSITEILSPECPSDSHNPYMCVDSQDNIHIVWRDTSAIFSAGGTFNIFYKKKISNLGGWTTLELATAESTANPQLPALVVDSLGDLHITWVDTIYAGCGFDSDVFYKIKYSFTGVWTPPQVISDESNQTSVYPAISIDSSDTIYLVWTDSSDIYDAGTDSDLFYRTYSAPDSALRTPELALIIPNPSETNTIYLNWNDIPDALEYAIYRESSYIWSIEDLTPLDYTSSSEYIDTLPSEGFYFYVIVANGPINSSHSNCEYVQYKLPTLPEYILPAFVLVGLSTIMITAILRKKRK